ncbi:hypothetical protein K9L67_03245 [Candidatus Woesearchaeota archaeon]|nr:hypothetical protein [Candidatus Woesearchaeota archaeon]MCF7901217.1 hypothetical protein [Candidatus Woesearchaeota archaeon]MCF8013746.1 hypothetical protein [Candidatus Woesearchaeota archaeon]
MQNNEYLINQYIKYRLNPNEKLQFSKITELRAKRIRFNIQKINKKINKKFSKYTEKDLEQFFEKLKSGELKKSRRLKVEGDIPILKQKIPFSKSAYYNMRSDFSNFWTFLVYKHNFIDIFLFIKK